MSNDINPVIVMIHQDWRDSEPGNNVQGAAAILQRSKRIASAGGWSPPKNVEPKFSDAVPTMGLRLPEMRIELQDFCGMK
jgi:hypothetical protein